jgi:uncharacterized protein YjbJ (UPF0337 family)
MNLEVVAGRWKQVQGAMLCKWGRYTANQFAVLVGEQYRVNGRIQERLGRLQPITRPKTLHLVR